MRRSSLLAAVVALVAATVTATPLAAVPPNPPKAAASGADFDGDGFDDLAVGVPGEAVGGRDNAGAVHVLYGSAAGLSADGSQLWHQDVAGVEGAAEAGDAFGDALAWGDFDGDGFGDLAIGVPKEDVDHRGDGAVCVLYGSPAGLSAAEDQFWYQGTSGVQGGAEEADFFGTSLAAGDFNGDGYADLAVGAPNEDIEDVLNAGAVNVLYGSADGLAALGNQIWHQDTPGVKGTATGKTERQDGFGQSLAGGDFDGDGFADLAVGVPGEQTDGFKTNAAGAVNVLYGSSTGLTASGDQIWDQDSDGVKGASEGLDLFGWALASGDFDGDGFADLAIGVPWEAVGETILAGAVNVLYGSGSGLTASGDQIWHQDTSGVRGAAEEGDEFGDALAAGHFDQDGFADLAVGVPYEEVDGTDQAGAVAVLYGTPTGLSASVDDLWHQDTPRVEGQAEAEDRFGSSLSAGDFGKGPEDDLAIGVPFEDVGTVHDAGAVNVLYGSTGDGLSAPGSQLWSQESPGIEGQAEANDFFGRSLPG